MYFEHLHDKKFTYFEHMKRAWSISFTMWITSIKTFIHGIYPDIFVTSATDVIQYLYEDILNIPESEHDKHELP